MLSTWSRTGRRCRLRPGNSSYSSICWFKPACRQAGAAKTATRNERNGTGENIYIPEASLRAQALRNSVTQ